MANVVNRALREKLGFEIIGEEHNLKSKPEIWYAFRCRPKIDRGLIGFGEQHTQIMVRIYQKIGGRGSYDILSRCARRNRTDQPLMQPPGDPTADLREKVRSQIAKELGSILKPSETSAKESDRPFDVNDSTDPKDQ
jgi:hypothetical protein